MTTRASGDTTLPSVNPSLTATAAERLVLTILFHPEPARIGEGASRCKIAGSDLSGTIALSLEQLRLGQVISLGHGVVLHLRLTALCEGDGASDIGLLGHSDSMAFLRQQVELAAGSPALPQ